MTHLLHTVRDLSVRWKIILPFVLLATVTWFVAASILERSSTEAITTQSRAEARRVSDAAAHHLALRVRFIGREVAIQCLQAEVFDGHVTAENTVDATRPGIPEMYIPRMFTRFFRVPEQSMKAHGSGLGLYICKQIIEKHCGSIKVSSSNSGTTFSISLPYSLSCEKVLTEEANL